MCKGLELSRHGKCNTIRILVVHVTRCAGLSAVMDGSALRRGLDVVPGLRRPGSGSPPPTLEPAAAAAAAPVQMLPAGGDGAPSMGVAAAQSGVLSGSGHAPGCGTVAVQLVPTADASGTEHVHEADSPVRLQLKVCSGAVATGSAPESASGDSTTAGRAQSPTAQQRKPSATAAGPSGLLGGLFSRGRAAGGAAKPAGAVGTQTASTSAGLPSGAASLGTGGKGAAVADGAPNNSPLDAGHAAAPAEAHRADLALQSVEPPSAPAGSTAQDQQKVLPSVGSGSWLGVFG